VSLFMRGQTFWSQFYVGGIRYQESTRTSNRRQAELVEKKLREQVQLQHLGITRVDPYITFGEITAKFIANGMAKPFHLDRLKQILPFCEQVPVLRMTKGLANEYRSWRHRERALTEATVNRDLACIRHILFWALDEGLIATNPLARLRLVQERRIKARVMGVLEEDGLLEVAAPHLRRMIVTSLYTGMRRGELLNQLWEHIDFERNVLYVTRSKTAGGEGREIPLARKVIEVLQEIRRSSGYVFQFHGDRIRSYKTAWKFATSAALPYHFRFHDLRHTANTRMMESGTIADVRKAILGHSTGREINARYTHVELPVKREAINKLELWVEQQKRRLREQRSEGGKNDSSEASRPATGPGNHVAESSAKAVGEEITRRRRARTMRKTTEESLRSQDQLDDRGTRTSET
jgi:integrase